MDVDRCKKMLEEMWRKEEEESLTDTVISLICEVISHGTSFDALRNIRVSMYSKYPNINTIPKQN